MLETCKSLQTRLPSTPRKLNVIFPNLLLRIFPKPPYLPCRWKQLIFTHSHTVLRNYHTQIFAISLVSCQFRLPCCSVTGWCTYGLLNRWLNGLYYDGWISVWNSQFKPFKPSRCIKASFYIPENRPYFSTTGGFRIKISMKLVYNTWQFSWIFHLLQIIFIHYKSRIATAIRGL